MRSHPGAAAAADTEPAAGPRGREAETNNTIKYGCLPKTARLTE